MTKPYVIGIDAGTESLRAGLFDLSGRPLASAATPVTTHFPRAGWAEQDPREWWAALGQSTRRALAEAGIAGKQVAGLAADTTCCSVVALDEGGGLLRPALLWMDVRATSQAARVAASGDPALEVNGAGRGPVSAEWMIPKSLWLKEEDPQVWHRARHICDCQDYLNFKMTGRMVANITSASTRWHYNSRRGGYPGSLLETLDLSELLHKWPEQVLPLGEVIGGLTPEAAEHLGLPAGLPVAQGGSDAYIGVLGLGVVKPDQLALITGSSHNHLGLTQAEVHGPGFWGTYPDALIPGLHAIEGGQTSTGSVVNWYKKLLGEGVSYVELNRDAEVLPPGSEGLVVLDHFQGNRTPYTDSLSRGAFVGLTLKHGPAHLFRAIIEGVCFGTELILETMRDAGFTPEDAVICGGATHSELWLAIHADVSGIPLKLTEVPNAPLLGSAILAATGAGCYPNIASAAAAMVRVVRTIEPDPQTHAAYREPYEAYKALYPALAEQLHRQAASGPSS